MPILLAIAAVLLILVLIASALWDRDGDDAGDDNGASTSQESTDPTDPSDTDDATTVAPDATSPDTTSPDATSPDTTSAPTTSPPITQPTTPATTSPSGGGSGGTGGSGGSGGTGGTGGSGTDGGDDKGDGRVVVIEGTTGPCKFGNSCLLAGFRVIGFPSGEKEYVCEFRDGSRHTYKFGARTVEYACATGARGDSITIEVDGVRSATIRTGDDFSTK